MHHDGVVAPQEDCDYTVTLGQSVLAVGSADSNEQRSGTVGHALFQYKFTPASVDTTIPGLVRVDESGGATVLRGTTARSVDGAITFKGKMIEQKDTECLLIFDGSSFRLERCDFALAQLRHIRSVPSQRRMPNGASSTEGKKNPKESTTARSRRPARPLASDNRKSLARLSSDSASQQDDSVTTVDASHQQIPSPLTTSPSTHVNDNGASPQAKRRRSEL